MHDSLKEKSIEIIKKIQENSIIMNANQKVVFQLIKRLSKQIDKISSKYNIEVKVMDVIALHMISINQFIDQANDDMPAKKKKLEEIFTEMWSYFQMKEAMKE
jgi:uncharacterized hydantoinase/oxoprolinase family protein